MKYKKVIIGILTFVLMCLTGIELRADLATPKSIRIECPDEVARGGTITCICIATYDNGVSKEVKPEWTIESGDYYGAIVTSGNHGMLTGKAAGTVTVRARYYTGTSYTPTAIPAAFTISTATKRVNVYELSSLEINGPDKVTVGGTVNFTCTANYSNGTRSAVKPTWSISSGGVYGSIYPSVDGFTGIFTGKADGIVTVQAQFTDSGVTKTVTKNVTVGVILNSLTIYGKSSVNVGSTSIYTCKATYSDGSTKTVTPIWSISSGGSYASITSGGVLTGNAAGSVGIKASYTEGGVTQTEVVRVTITTVVVKPSIETQPRSQTVTEGSSVTFSVTASGSTPLNYQWKKNGTAISGATSASYTIKSATTSDAGSYTVTVSNSAGSVTSSAATLTVGGKPSITTQPKSQTVDEDSSVTFSVAASGTAPLSYQWYKGSRKISGATSSTYKINSVKSSDAGSYYVVVGNSAGSVTSSGAMLNVLVKPGITTQPKSQTVTEGSSVTFSVVVEGDSNSNHYQTVSSDSPSGIEGDKAVVFNGVDYLCGWTDQLFDVTKPITIETWVYIDPASEKSIEGFVSYGKTLKIGCTSDHYFVFTMSGVEDVKSSIPVDPVNGWQHLAAAWTPGVGVTFYFNGMEWETVETTAMPNAPTKEIVNDLKVYRITVGAEALDYPTQGMMDRVRIHQAVLSEGELDSEAANPKSIRSNTLCAFDFNNEAKLLSSSTTTSVIVPNYLAASNDSPSGKVGDMSGKFNGIGGGYGTFDTEPLDLTKPVTWEAWVNVDIGRVTNYEEYFRIGNTFKIGANADHFFEVTLAGVVDIPSTVVQMSAGGGWSHVAAVWEPGVGVTFYQDGFEYERIEATQLPNAYQNKIISIGSNNTGGNGFKGKLDRMRIYNRALTDTELDSDPTTPKPIGDAVLAWDFNSETLPFVGTGRNAINIYYVCIYNDIGYQWYKDGKAISGATSSTYKINNVKTSDAGKYTVKVSNSAGSVTSSEATLTVNAASVTLSSITISGSSSVDVGSTATYTCKAKYSDGSTKTVKPTWSISSGGSYATITSGGVLTGKAAGTATVKASYSEGGVTKAATKSVTVNESFAYHPADTNKDQMITISEVTAYAKAWKSGETWPVGPNPIDISYLTRAGALWKGGENYYQNKTQEAPMCWVNELTIQASTMPVNPIDLDLIVIQETEAEVESASDSVVYSTISGETVTITVAPEEGVSVYAVEDTLPSGWTVRGINENGVFDSVNHKVKWGPWFDNSPRTLTYTLVIPDDFSGMATLNGTASFDGVDTAITGDRDIRISGDFSDFLIIRKESNGTRGEEEKVTITFTGTLQESTDMKIWKDVTDVSPYTTIIGKEKKFYRSVR